MANVSINELKIRVLQLKGLGYDKLLLQNELNEKLSKVQRDLGAISDEVTQLIQIIKQAEEETENTTSETKQSVSNDAQQSQSISETENQQFLKVDKDKLNDVLSPQTSQQRSTKTEHNIGRRLT